MPWPHGCCNANPMRDDAFYHHSDGRGLAQIAEPGLLRLAEYWLAKRADRPMPTRQDIDPLDIPWALSNIYLVDYERGTGTFRYRLAGNEIEEVFRSTNDTVSMRGATLQDLLGPAGAHLVEKRWKNLVTKGDLIYMRGLIYQIEQRVLTGARLLLPLSDREDHLPTGLLGMTLSAWQAAPPLASDNRLDVYSIPLAELG